MRVLWSVEDASVEQVRLALPAERRGAYTTIQTVLNRLAERGLLERARSGKALRYSAKVSEADYLSSSLHRALDGASSDARRSALANLVGDLGPEELEAISSRAREIRRRRDPRS